MTIFKFLLPSLIALTLWPKTGQACTIQTLDDMTDNIKFYNDDVPVQVDLAIQNITQLCDENLYVAGYDIGQKFSAYEPARVRKAAQVLEQRLQLMSADMG